MIVLDTHAWLWWVSGDAALSRKAENRVIVATALLESAVLVTRDSRIREHSDVETVW